VLLKLNKTLMTDGDQHTIGALKELNDYLGIGCA
jgi:hypothetical protein